MLRNKSSPTMECTRKKITREFQAEGLCITFGCNFSCTDFLYVCFDLNEKTYIPYRKPNNTPFYIHARSSHFSIVMKHLPQIIGRRISDLFCNKTAFKKTTSEYNQTLQRSSFKHTIMYKPSQSSPHRSNNNNKKKRKRIIIRFNPPFSENVATSIRKEFFSLFSKHFPPNNKYHKIFNKVSSYVTVVCPTWEASSLNTISMIAR